jgi:hypothetical protein
MGRRSHPYPADPFLDAGTRAKRGLQISSIIP